VTDIPNGWISKARLRRRKRRRKRRRRRRRRSFICDQNLARYNNKNAQKNGRIRADTKSLRTYGWTRRAVQLGH
jgi:hypothetical protein